MLKQSKSFTCHFILRGHKTSLKDALSRIETPSDRLREYGEKPMELQDTVEIKVVSPYLSPKNLEAEVNMWLRQGWKILFIGQGKDDERAWTQIVLAKFKTIPNPLSK